MSRFDAVETHRRIATVLTAEDLKTTFFFESIDNEITADQLSGALPQPSTIAMVLEAAERCALSASFSVAHRYIQVSEGM